MFEPLLNSNTTHREKFTRLTRIARLRVRDIDPAVAIKGFVQEVWRWRWEGESSTYLKWTCLLNKNIIFEENAFEMEMGGKSFFSFPVSGEAWQWHKSWEVFWRWPFSLSSLRSLFLASWVSPSWSSILLLADPFAAPRFAKEENTHRVQISPVFPLKSHHIFPLDCALLLLYVCLRAACLFWPVLCAHAPIHKGVRWSGVYRRHPLSKVTGLFCSLPTFNTWHEGGRAELPRKWEILMLNSSHHWEDYRTLNFYTYSGFCCHSWPLALKTGLHTKDSTLRGNRQHKWNVLMP